jgi:two-component system, response regulator YesN
MEFKKIVIVDDEVIPKEDIKSAVDWEKHGYMVAGEASNGLQALETIRYLKPDVLITDLKMPVMDGLELIRQLHEEEIDIKIIILTCYEEFEYAREALRLGALDYLLKHTMEAGDIIKLIDMLNKSFQKDEVEESNRKFLKHNVLSGLLLGLLTAEELKHYRQKGILSFTGNYFIIAAASTDNPMRSVSGMKRFVDYLLDVRHESFQLSVSYPTEGMPVVVFYSDTLSDISLWIPAIQLLFQTPTETILLSGPVHWGISKVYHKVEQLHAAYQDAKQAIAFTMHYGPHSVIAYDWVKDHLKPEHSNELMDIVEKCWEELTLHNGGDPANIFQKWFETMSKVPKDNKFYQRLYEQFRIRFIPSHESIGQEVAGSDAPSFASAAELKTAVHELIAQSLRHQEEQQSLSKKIRMAIGFIRQHYARELSLEEIAQYAGVSRIYLSQRFKKETGQNLSDFLLNVRMDKAKKLLIQTDFKVYEIAEKVGFQNAQHFSHVFKKLTGVSAHDFKNKLQFK